MAAITVGFMTRLGTVVLPPISAGDGTLSTAESTPPAPTDSAAAKAPVVQNALQNAITYFLTSQAL